MAISSSSQNCDASRKEYLGNGVGRDFLIGFEYYERSDVGVANWNTITLDWDVVPQTNNWLFLNDQTIRFNTAPAYNQKFLIYRQTDVDSLPANFTPGTSIKAAELNSNFDVLKYAVEEVRCDQSGSGSILSTAIRKVQQVEGDVESQNLIDDSTVFTSAASSARHDNIVSDNLPTVVAVEQPGKIWNDTDGLVDYFWDPDGEVWVSFTKSGPSGATGSFGPPGKVITSDIAPVAYPAVGTNASRPLESGDLWFDTANALLFVYYVDSVSSQWVTISKTPTGVQPNSPAFTGTPTAPTAAQGTNTTQIATTEFVNAEIAADTSGLAPLASPAFTGTPTAPTAAQGTNTTQLATTEFVNAEISADTANLAPLASPTFTGTPAAPTATQGTNTTQIATTSYVQNEIGQSIQAYDANLPAGNTILVDSDIGVGVQAYDANLPAGNTILVDSDIGVGVQAYDADTAKTDVAQSFTAAQRGDITELSGTSFTLDLNASNNFKLSPSGTFTVALSNLAAAAEGQTGSIFIVYSGTESGSFPTTMKFVGGAAGITLTSTAGAIDRIDYIVLNSTTVTCNFTANYVQ